jgi:putative salt-induced outer membrane protein YdiY
MDNLKDPNTRSLRAVASFVVVAWLATTYPSFADVVVTSDGSRIIGRIDQIHDDVVRITTKFAGTLEIKSAQVVALATDAPITIQLHSGDRLVGPLDIGPDATQSIIRSSVGALPIALDQVGALWPQDAEDPFVVAVKEEAQKEIERLRPKWSSTLEAGGVLKEGNTDTLDARGRFDVKRKTPDDLLEFYLAAEYSEQDDLRTKNEYRGGVRYESTFNERKYWYTRLALEFDEFENLDLRSTAAFGFGYYWMKKPAIELKTSVGLGYRHESFDMGDTQDSAVIDLGLDFRYDLGDWAQFTHTAAYAPDFEDFDDYRLDLDTAIVLPFKNDNWKLKLGVRNEYNAQPQRGIDRLDNTYYANVVLNLK